MNYKIKTGIGFDVHKFSSNRKLILGGIEIPYHLGLEGHSDADVLCHSIADSILGITLGVDIGELFPDNDIKYKDANSLDLLSKTISLVRDKGFDLINVDSVIVAEAPKITPYKIDIRKSLSSCLKMNYEDVTVKASTSEKLGFVGRGEGITVLSVATVIKVK